MGGHCIDYNEAWDEGYECGYTSLKNRFKEYINSDEFFALVYDAKCEKTLALDVIEAINEKFGLNKE